MHPTDLTISEYVDDALGAVERTDVERHLTTCEECRLLVDGLREVRQQAATLAPLQPPAHAWERIEQAIRVESSGPRRRVSWSWLAAAAVLILGTIAGLRFWLPARQGGAAPGAPAVNSRELAQNVESELLQAEQHYQKAISGLQQIANAEKGALDPKTAATVEENLATIDRAISESRAALKIQPHSEPAQQSLLESFKSKISLLEDTVALINEMRKGNDAGTAVIVSGIKQKS